jgi:hypothetical protein
METQTSDPVWGRRSRNDDMALGNIMCQDILAAAYNTDKQVFPTQMLDPLLNWQWEIS